MGERFENLSFYPPFLRKLFAHLNFCTEDYAVTKLLRLKMHFFQPLQHYAASAASQIMVEEVWNEYPLRSFPGSS